MLNKFKIKRTYKIIFSCLMIFLLIGLVEKNHGEKFVQQIVITVEQQYDNFFVDRSDIHKLITNDNAINVIGKAMNEIDLKEIEERIKTNRFVKSVDVYKDLKGALIVNIEQRKPIARVISNTGPDSYISESGVILPTSDKYTARVVLVSGKNVDQLTKEDLSIDEENESLLKVLQYINGNTFWRAQVAQIEIDKKDEITIYPQVGRQVISFGTSENFEVKFRNLKIFFKKILPQKGWNHYKRVNIKYNNQIVCE